MSFQRLLRFFILGDLAAMVAGLIAAVLFEGTLPEPLRTYAASEEPHPLFLIAGVILLVLLIVAWVGLWRRASWAPAVYVVMWVSCGVMMPFAGPYVATGIEEMFDFVSTSAGGAILAMVVLMIQQRRRADAAAGGEGQATPLPLSDTDGPERPDEHLPPHLKSRRAHWVLSVFYGLIALMMLALPFVAADGEEVMGPREVAMALAFPFFFFAFATLHYVVARGAKERKRWARIGSIVLACVLLPGLPLGTLLGVYLLRNSSWEPRSDATAGA